MTVVMPFGQMSGMDKRTAAEIEALVLYREAIEAIFDF